MTAAEIEALVMELSNESIQRRGYFPVACIEPLKLGQVVNNIGYLPYPAVLRKTSSLGKKKLTQDVLSVGCGFCLSQTIISISTRSQPSSRKSNI